MERNRGSYSFKIDIGQVRISNEDQARIVANAHGDILMVVCDGLGGHSQGDYASKIAVDTLCDYFLDHGFFFSYTTLKNWMRYIINTVNKKIFNLSETNATYHGMATTLVAAVIRGNRVLTINVGDSRAYFFSEGLLKCITSDQTVVNYLYRTGKIKQEDVMTHPNKNILTNALGLYPSVSADMFYKSYKNESILLCSDGLYNNISVNEISAILDTKDTVEQKCSTLVGTANANGGSDNIAVALWEKDND